MRRGKALVRSNPTSPYFSRSHLISGASLLTFVAGWYVLSHVGPAYAFPYWSKIIVSLENIPYQDVLITLFRLLISMALSFVIGLACSLLLFERPDLEAFFLPLIRLLMAVPAVCWVVFAILWFRGVESRIYFVMIVTCGPVFAIDSLDAMKGVPNDLKQMARSFRPSNLPDSPHHHHSRHRSKSPYELEDQSDACSTRRDDCGTGGCCERHRSRLGAGSGDVFDLRRFRVDDHPGCDPLRSTRACQSG